MAMSAVSSAECSVCNSVNVLKFSKDGLLGFLVVSIPLVNTDYIRDTKKGARYVIKSGIIFNG